MIDHSIFYSKIVVTFFLVFNFLLMLNLLIAVMLEDYSRLSSSARTLYLRWLIQIHPLWKADSLNGFLTYKFGPLALLNLLLSPFVLLCKSHRLNRCLELFNFLIPLMLMAVLFCFIDVFYFF